MQLISFFVPVLTVYCTVHRGTLKYEVKVNCSVANSETRKISQVKKNTLFPVARNGSNSPHRLTQRDQRGAATADCWNWGKMRTQGAQMKGVLPRLVRWTCRAEISFFCPALAALVGLEQNIYNSFVPIVEQAEQVVVLGRLSLSLCLWFNTEGRGRGGGVHLAASTTAPKLEILYLFLFPLWTATYCMSR